MTKWPKQCGAEARALAIRVLEDYGLTLEQMRLPAASRVFSRPRQHVMYELTKDGRYSYPAVGRFLNRDHSTVHYGARAHKERAGL